MDGKIAAKYAEKKRSYFGRHVKDVMLTLVVLFIVFGSMLSSSYNGMMKQARANWSENKCNPIYLPFAGTIMPQVGQTTLETTTENFNFCIHRNLSEAFSILLMPLEFVNFLILSTLDMMIQAMVAALKLYQFISKRMDKFSKDTENKLADFLVPLILIITNIRDTIAKVSASIATVIHTALTIKYIIQSGLLNVVNIILDMLIILSGIIIAMYAAGIVMCALMVTIAPGLVMIGIATVLMLVIFLPILIIYVLLAMFMNDVFGSGSVRMPPIPTF